MEGTSAMANYVHTQNAAASIWTIQHNLATYPAVVVVDSAGDEVEGEVRYTTANLIILSFSAPFAGIAYLR